MPGRKRNKPQPKVAEPRVQEDRKPTVPVSSHKRSVKPDEVFFAYKFAGRGSILVPTVDVKLLPPDREAVMYVKACRGVTTIEQTWKLKDGKNNFQNLSVEAEDTIELWCNKPLSEVWVSFLWREA